MSVWFYAFGAAAACMSLAASDLTILAVGLISVTLGILTEDS